MERDKPLFLPIQTFYRNYKLYYSIPRQAATHTQHQDFEITLQWLLLESTLYIQDVDIVLKQQYDQFLFLKSNISPLGHL